MKALSCITILLVIASVSSGSTIGSPPPQHFTKVATIDLGYSASNSPFSLASGEMYYTVQKNQTLVAVNVTSEAVVYHIDLPHDGVAAMAASKSGYTAVSLFDAQTNHIFDPEGSFVSKGTPSLCPPFRQHGPDSLVYGNLKGSGSQFVSLNLKTGQQTVLQEGPFNQGVVFPSEEAATTVVLTTACCGADKIFEYNYETNVTNWVITDLNNGNYKGQDATHIFVSNQSVSTGEHYLLVLNKATLKKEAQLAHISGNVGEHTSTPLVPPVVKGGLINIIHGYPRQARAGEGLEIVNLSTGVVVKQQRLHYPVVLAGTHLVSWGSEVFSVFTYPGGATTVNKTLSTSASYPPTLTPLPGTDLVVGTSNTKMQVREVTTGALVYEQPSANLWGTLPGVMAKQQLLVVTNGDKADVFQIPAPSPAPTPPVPTSSCSQYLTCVECTSSPSGTCGFCPGAKVCLEGTQAGPSHGVKCSFHWEWFTSQCNQ